VFILMFPFCLIFGPFADGGEGFVLLAVLADIEMDTYQ